MTTVITSKDHPVARLIRRAAAGGRRAPRGLVVAEGVRVLESATRADCGIEGVVLAPDFGSTPREAALVAEWQGRGARIYRAAGRLLEGLSDVRTAQGGIALVRVPVLGPSDLDGLQLTTVVCACGVQDPGNLGSLLRSARAAGAELVVTTRGTVSARNPKTIRSSAGAYFGLAVAEGLRPAELVDLCRRRGIRIVRCEPDGPTPVWDVDLSAPVALLLGNEARGFGDADWQGIERLSIPMASGSESLNVAAAGAVVLFEIRRQRAAEGQP